MLLWGAFDVSLLDLAGQEEVWERFYEYKASLACPKQFCRYLRFFIAARAYEPVIRNIRAARRFPLPKKSVISKQFSEKKRTVYTYPEPENTVLKLITHLLCRQYDASFSANLYSFRPGRGAKDAVRAFLRLPDINKLCAYKVDISNYFNSVPVEKMLPLLRERLKDDAPLKRFLEELLTEEKVLFQGNELIEQKGIMAGTPLSAFYANLYLDALDRLFEKDGIPYARYSDDIIVFAPGMDKAREYAARIRAFLDERGLTVNPDKEQFFTPEEGWSFLGFDYCGGMIDIAQKSLDKIKRKMRRKARALSRWQRRNALSGLKAAKAFIRIFNHKLFESPEDNELSWCRWYFPVINTAKSLSELDRYAQDCIRFLMTGKHTKARFNARYEDMKKLGYKSLVHEYYAFKRQKPC